MAKSKPPIFPPLIINVYKPKGIGSSDVVRHFKYNLPSGFGKIGHLGTLDPFAEGVLLIAIAGASRLSNLIHDSFPKTYEAEGLLGQSFDTGDITGNLINEDPGIESRLIDLGVEALNRVAKAFEGEYLQVPPYYSATKHEGVPLHKLARQGTFITKKPVKRIINSFEVLSIEGANIRFKCEVSSGTYIRVLFEDFAKKLGTLGVLKHLKRTKIGPFSLTNCLKRENWPTRGDDFKARLVGQQSQQEANPCFCPGFVFNDKVFRLSEERWEEFKNGKNVGSDIEGLNDGEVIGLFSPSGRVCALATLEGAYLKPIVRFSPFID